MTLPTTASTSSSSSRDQDITRRLEVDRETDGDQEHRHAEGLAGMDEPVAQAVSDMRSGDRDTGDVGAGDGRETAPLLEDPGGHEHQADHPGQPAALELELVEQVRQVVTEDVDERRRRRR